MFYLDSALPESVWMDGAEYPIRSDFRIMIRFARLIKDTETLTAETVARAIRLFYKTSVHSPEAAMDALFRFYHCDLEDSDEAQPGPAWKPKPPGYCFDYDAKYIYAAFLEQYRIDLIDAEHLHWFKFIALFGALGETTMMHKIMGYRSMDISKLGKHQRPFYQEMKKAYQLPMNARDRAQMKEIEAALMNGGDLSSWF